MIVDILPFRLQLASLDKKDIPLCTHQLMKLVLFPSGPRHFFSYTETDKEVSLILDQSHIRGFPEGALSVCNVVWRAVQIEPGESGLGPEEVVSRVSRPLAEINISIMQISTYDADFTLMPECELQRALECLDSLFTISNKPLEELGLQAGDLDSWTSSYPMSPSAIHSLQDALLLEQTVRGRQSSVSADSGISSVGTDEEHSAGSSSTSPPDSANIKQAIKARHPFNANYPHRLHITSMEQSLMDVLAIRLLESLFFDTRTDRFFSFTQSDTTLSIIMDDATMNLFPEHTLNMHEGDWRLIAIGDGPLGFDECGIVSESSRPLSENGISLFYLSTFNSDYIMVNDQDFEQAVAYLSATTTNEASLVSSSSPSPPPSSSSASETVSDTVTTLSAVPSSIAPNSLTAGEKLTEGRRQRTKPQQATGGSGSGSESSDCDSESDPGSEADSASEVDPEDGGDADIKNDDDIEVVFETDQGHLHT